MNYNTYLLTMLFIKYCTEFENLEYDEQFRLAPLIYKVFADSEYNDPKRDVYTCIALWLDSIDWAYAVVCDCGHWETMPADMPRHKIQTFEWIKNNDVQCTAYYKCPDCSATVRSEVVPDFDVE